MTGEGLKVLVAEDDYIGQYVITGMLKSMGLGADIAICGREAVELYRNNRYQLILMDCLMPQMDGYQATRMIREMERSNGVKERSVIIALTARALKGDREECLASGMDEYLAKPIQLKTLQSMIQKYYKFN